MNTHPDIAATAAAGIYLERIGAARHARLIREAQRLQPRPERRRSLARRIAQIVTRRRQSTTRRTSATSVVTPQPDRSGHHALAADAVRNTSTTPAARAVATRVDLTAT